MPVPAGGGAALNGGTSGATPTASNDISNTGTLNTSYSPATLTSATYDASSGVLSVTAAGMTTGDTIDVTKLTLTGQAAIPIP